MEHSKEIPKKKSLEEGILDQIEGLSKKFTILKDEVNVKDSAKKGMEESLAESNSAVKEPEGKVENKCEKEVKELVEKQKNEELAQKHPKRVTEHTLSDSNLALREREKTKIKATSEMPETKGLAQNEGDTSLKEGSQEIEGQEKNAIKQPTRKELVEKHNTEEIAKRDAAKVAEKSLEEVILESEVEEKKEPTTKPIIDKQETSVDTEQSDYELFDVPRQALIENMAPNVSSDLTQLNWDTVESAPEIGATFNNKIARTSEESTQTDETKLERIERCLSKESDTIKDELIREAELVHQTLEVEIQEIINFINTQKNSLEKKFEESLSEHDKHKFQILVDLSKEVKDLCKSGIKTIQKDLQSILNAGKSKWDDAMSEMHKVEASADKTEASI